MLEPRPISDLVAEDKRSHQTPFLSLESRASRLDNELFPFASALQGRGKFGLRVLENYLNSYLVLGGK